MNQREILLLDQVLEMDSAPTFTELQSSSGLPKATVHRCLNNLEQSRLLYRRENRFYPGALLLRWLHLPTAKKNVWSSLLHPYLLQCSQDFGEVVHLVQRQGQTAIYIDKVESEGPIVFKSRIGAELDLYKTAAGLAILAELAEADLKQYVQSLESHYSETELAAFHRYSGSLQQELQQTRERGYSMEVEQNEKNIQCVGISLKSVHPDLALSVSMTTLVPLPELRRIGEGLRRMARKISEDLLHQ